MTCVIEAASGVKTRLFVSSNYGVATIIRLLKMIGLATKQNRKVRKVR